MSMAILSVSDMAISCIMYVVGLSTTSMEKLKAFRSNRVWHCMETIYSKDENGTGGESECK